MSALAPFLLAVALTSVGVDEHVGARVPGELPFLDAQGHQVTLDAALGDGTTPAVLVLAYARCTLLCNTVLHNLATAVHGSARAPGRDVRLVVVDIDDHARADEAARKQATLLSEAGLPDDPARWPYLVGVGDSVPRLAATLGFRYAWDARTRQYIHPAVVFVLTPDHRVSRYLEGVTLVAPTLEGAIDDAAAGRLVSGDGEALLRCFRFDPAHAARRARIEHAMQIGSGLVFFALSTLVGTLIIRERRRERS